MKQKIYEIIGAAMAVHNELGQGFLEAVYQEALELELLSRKIPFEREKPINVFYKGQQLEKFYVADFICYGEIIVELKALSALAPEHQAQLLNYLKATGLHKGLLINFGESQLKFKSFIY